MEDNSAQDDEILAIHSIYEEDETFIFDNDTKIGKFFVKISADDSKSFCLKFGKFSEINRNELYSKYFKVFK